MTKEEYTEYLKTPRWRLFSSGLIERVRKCQKCSFPYELNVHHKTYERLGNERREDVIVLCRSCHSREHFMEYLDGFMLPENSTTARIKQQIEESKKMNEERNDEMRINKIRERERFC